MDQRKKCQLRHCKNANKIQCSKICKRKQERQEECLPSSAHLSREVWNEGLWIFHFCNERPDTSEREKAYWLTVWALSPQLLDPVALDLWKLPISRRACRVEGIYLPHGILTSKGGQRRGWESFVSLAICLWPDFFALSLTPSQRSHHFPIATRPVAHEPETLVPEIAVDIKRIKMELERWPSGWKNDCYFRGPSLAPSTHIVVNACNSSSKGPNALVCSPQ